jgi:hypothetical protein
LQVQDQPFGFSLSVVLNLPFLVLVHRLVLGCERHANEASTAKAVDVRIYLNGIVHIDEDKRPNGYLLVREPDDHRHTLDRLGVAPGRWGRTGIGSPKSPQGLDVRGIESIAVGNDSVHRSKHTGCRVRAYSSLNQHHKTALGAIW